MIPSPAPSRGGEARLTLIRELLVSLPAAVAYVTGLRLVFEFANSEYRRLVGERDLLGRPIREALPELAGQGRFEQLDRVARTGVPCKLHQVETWIRDEGRSPRQVFLDFAYEPVRDDMGQVAGVLIYAADVTAHVRDRQRLEELARELDSSQERHRALFETLPLGVLHYEADGSVIEANPAALEILGIPPQAAITWPIDREQRAIQEDGSPFDPDEAPVRVALRTGEIVSDSVVGFPHGRTGEMRWLRVTAVPDARDEQGQPRRAYAIITDITEQHRAEAALRESERLLARLRDANVLGVVSSTEEGVYEANDAFLDMIGYSRADIAAGRLSYQMLTAPEFAGRDRAALERLRATGAFQAYDKEYVHRDGHRVPVMVGAVAIGRDPLRWVTFVVDVTARQRAERERAALTAKAQAAAAEADAARERLESLLRAGELVAATRSREELLEHVTQLVVPALADYCVAFLPTAEGMLRAAQFTHRDPARAAVLERLRDHPIPATGPLISQTAYTTGATQLASDFRADTPAWVEAAPGLMRILAQAQPASAVAAPLLVGRRPLGVLVLGRTESRPRFAKTDVALVEELARRLASGLANVDAFAREHTIAETLQRSLLPDPAIEVAGLDIAVHYLAAADGVHVGGDWYDVFPIDHDRVGLVIGDVAGHSIASASVMGQIRGAMRAYAVDIASPASVLRRTNAAIFRLLPETLATACYGVLDHRTGDFVYANAGHPPPLLIRKRGRAEYLAGAAGIMLGAREDSSYMVSHKHLRDGDKLLFYTDGLVEDRERDLTEGLAALALAARRSRALAAEQTCAAVQSELLADLPRGDDVCILAVGLGGPSRIQRSPSQPPPAATPSSPPAS